MSRSLFSPCYWPKYAKLIAMRHSCGPGEGLTWPAAGSPRPSALDLAEICQSVLAHVSPGYRGQLNGLVFSVPVPGCRNVWRRWLRVRCGPLARPTQPVAQCKCRTVCMIAQAPIIRQFTWQTQRAADTYLRVQPPLSVFACDLAGLQLLLLSIPASAVICC